MWLPFWPDTFRFFFCPSSLVTGPYVYVTSHGNTTQFKWEKIVNGFYNLMYRWRLSIRSLTRHTFDAFKCGIDFDSIFGKDRMIRIFQTDGTKMRNNEVNSNDDSLSRSSIRGHWMPSGIIKYIDLWRCGKDIICVLWAICVAISGQIFWQSCTFSANANGENAVKDF